MLAIFKDLMNKRKAQERDRDAIRALKNWYVDKYDIAVVQRNLLFVFSIAALITIFGSVLVIRYVRSMQTIEPFVIEIDEKTGVPTVVERIDIKSYSQDQVVQRYFIMSYIRAREEYISAMFEYNFGQVVRVMSTPDVYWTDYRPKFSASNPNSPVNRLAKHSSKKVKLKSIVFPQEGIAQVRVALVTQGVVNKVEDKFVYLEYSFENLSLNDDERLINPLGFVVKTYRIEDERG
jgi:type IV secretion system protein VirB8